MTQTLPALAVLGSENSGKSIGYRVLNLDGSEYSAFTTTNVAETGISGNYRVTNGIAAPDAGGYLIFGISGTDLSETVIEPVPTASSCGDATGIEFTYTVTDSTNGNPIEGVRVWITTDEAGNNVIWSGYTDTLGVAKDQFGNKPTFDAGTYYFWRRKVNYSFTNPDTEVIS